MNVHNLMEDIVEKNINDLYEQVKKDGCSWLTCDCLNCRLDTVNYVLNRIPPKYVVSGRGVTHSSIDSTDSQLKADIDALALEGMRIVSSTKRPFHSNDRSDCVVQTVMEPAFNFSTFTGSVLDGSTFEPVYGAEIVLKCDGQPVEMVDKTWMNPFTTCKSTKGVYTFWVKSIPAERAGIAKKFNFTMEIKAPGYTDLSYFFEVPVTSDPTHRNEVDATYSLKLKDIIIFKNFIENPME